MGISNKRKFEKERNDCQKVSATQRFIEFKITKKDKVKIKLTMKVNSILIKV